MPALLDGPTDGPTEPAASPLISDAGRPEAAEQLVSLLAPHSFAADQYRTLRHHVEGLRKESGFHVLAVTSSGPGDGKTVTTLNLAGTLAQNVDARVLVVDADLRRPKVPEYLGLAIQHAPGLVDIIQDPGSDLNRAVRVVEGFNLSVVPAGIPRVSPYEVLNSPRLDALLAEARRRYDWVLIDTPPVVVPDCRLLIKRVDGVLVVVGAHKTPRKLVAEALDLVDPAKIIGVVFNGVDRPLSGHYGYYGDYYARDTRRRSWWGWR